MQYHVVGLFIQMTSKILILLNPLVYHCNQVAFARRTSKNAPPSITVRTPDPNTIKA